MDANNDQVVPEMPLQLPQLRDHVDAIDSAIRPELEQDNPASQIIQRQRPFNVYPVEAGGETRSPGGDIELLHVSSPPEHFRAVARLATAPLMPAPYGRRSAAP